MCKFTKIEKMLIENGISNYGICHGAMEIQTSIYYIYMEKVSNGILLKVRYNEMTTYFTNMIVKNQNQALGLIEGRILESKEEQQNEQKEIKEVNHVELLKTIGNLIKEMHIERTTNGLTPKWHELKALKEELNKKARSIIDDNYKDILKEETQEETQETQEEDDTITFLNNEGHVTSAVIVSKDNPYLKEQCNHDLIQTTDGKYWELWTTYNGYLVAIDTDEYDQTETQVKFDFDNNCEYCGTIHNVEFRQTTLLGKYAFVCEHCLKNPNTETQETSCNYGKDSVDENCMNNKSSMLVAINNKDSQESICNFVPCGATKELTETIEPLLSLGDDITTQVFTSDHTSAPMFISNQLKKMIDTILYENDTDSFGTCKIAVYDHVDENKKPIYAIHVLKNDYMIEFDKNTQAVTKIYENEFGFECGLSLATRDYIFNPLMKIIADEIETIYNGLER